MVREFGVASAIAVAFNRNDLGVVREPVDEGDGADALGKMVSRCLKGRLVVTSRDFCS